MFKEDNSIGKIQQIINYIKHIFDRTKGVSGSNLDEALVASVHSEEEAELIKEMCEDVDLYYTKREDFRRSGLKVGDWFEKQVEQTVKDVYPEADAEDLDEVKTAVSNAIESEIEVITNLVEEEITPVTDALNKNNI